MPTPPMGFNNWARFECELNQTLFTTTADAMVKNGLLAAGYNRINLDDCWMASQRASNGTLQWNTTKFPDGLPWLGNFLHTKGFNFGIYEDAGTLTCGGFPGSLGYEDIDAKTFASWGIDYLKLDGCNVPTQSGLTSEETYKYIYGTWHTIFSNMTEPLIFSESAPAYFCGEQNLTDWYSVMDWVPSYGQLARHSYDIATYGSGNTWESILTNYGQEVLLARYQKPGYFNDPDFIIPDWPDLTIDEKKSHFALWASFSAPLIISADVPSLTSEELKYLTNADLIAVDQDELGLQATLVSQDGTWDILTKSLSNGDRLLTVLNRGNSSSDYHISLSRLGIETNQFCAFKIKDLWTGDITQSHSAYISVPNIPAHGTAVLRINLSSTCGGIVPTGMIFNTASLKCVDGDTNGSTLSASCDGSNGQVWHVETGGKIRNLAKYSQCLAERSNGETFVTTCDGKDKYQQWKYYLSGNIVNFASGHCLTELENGTLGTAACQQEANSQVFGLPSGVEVL
ncbi:hypothetical protein BGW36DRAFT_400887 [Talaromyces proteolyticus]|uniref:Alpha-galactosidase n=1 Tax=Talaromyces proteolyticus TaxID=1131652 RepID=A0AAD4KH69_9EURO|nr:uncharacterized protein BGW36DRAFT_400887 [Talaromyces proteolyticus]KAH8691661.1 hypothetical protein BGW36DRAFT_400887 [Talaromyces proteolyticus]